MEAALWHAKISNIINWLETEWAEVQELFLKDYESKSNDVISLPEAHEALVNNPGDYVKALEECKKERENKVG